MQHRTNRKGCGVDFREILAERHRLRLPPTSRFPCSSCAEAEIFGCFHKYCRLSCVAWELPPIRESTLPTVDSEAQINKVLRGPDTGTVDSGLGGFEEYHRIRLITDTWCSHDRLRNHLY